MGISVLSESQISFDCLFMNTPWIQHFSRSDIKSGLHYDPGMNTVLIQIKDCNEDWVIPAYKDLFRSIHQFEFEDTNDEKRPNCISDNQAMMLAQILRKCYAENLNVIVHCVAGLCRSSAVAVAGKAIGFQLEDKIRIPNSLVKRKIFDSLGIGFSPELSTFLLLPEDAFGDSAYGRK